MTAAHVASVSFWIIAGLDLVISVAYALEYRLSLAIAFFAFGIASAAMAWV